MKMPVHGGWWKDFTLVVLKLGIKDCSSLKDVLGTTEGFCTLGVVKVGWDF